MDAMAPTVRKLATVRMMLSVTLLLAPVYAHQVVTFDNDKNYLNMSEVFTLFHVMLVVSSCSLALHSVPSYSTSFLSLSLYSVPSYSTPSRSLLHSVLSYSVYRLTHSWCILNPLTQHPLFPYLVPF